jgi:biopolymer transport protein ExbD
MQRIFCLLGVLFFACCEAASPKQSEPPPTKSSLPATETAPALPSLKLPKAAHTAPSQATLSLQLSSKELSLKGQKIADTVELQKMLEKPIPGTKPFLLPILVRSLKAIPEKGVLRFEAEPTLSFSLIWMLLFSSYEAGFDEISLITEGGQQLALTSPAGKLLSEMPTTKGKSEEDEFGLGLKGTGIGGGGTGEGTICTNKDKDNASFVWRTGGAPDASEGKVTVKGNIEKDAVRRVVKRAMPSIKFCYEQALTRDSSLAGKVNIFLVIAQNGAVSSASPTSGIESELDSCVARKFSQLSFPEPKDGGIAEVDYAIIFETLVGVPDSDTPEDEKKALKRPKIEVTSKELILSKKEKLSNTADGFEALSLRLSELKKKLPSQDNIWLVIREDVLYQDIIQIADTCVGAGFASVSLTYSPTIKKEDPK